MPERTAKANVRKPRSALQANRSSATEGQNGDLRPHHSSNKRTEVRVKMSDLTYSMDRWFRTKDE